MAVTLKDIARTVGVDPAAVSRALNDVPNSRLRKETCEKIKETARKMGYRKNLLAASVRKGYSRTLAVIYDFGTSSNGFSDEQLAGIMEKCVTQGYDVKIYAAAASPEETFGQILSSGIKYAAIFSLDHAFREKASRLARESGITLVLMDESSLNGFPSVNIDNVAAVGLLVEHFVENGYKRIGFWGVEKDHFIYQKLRREGFLGAMKKHELPFPEEWLFDADKDLEKECERLFSMEKNSRPEAMVFMGEGIAVSVQFYMLRHDFSVPGDLAMAAFGYGRKGMTAFSPVTAVVPCVTQKEQGCLALDVLFGSSKLKPDGENNILIPPELIVRESSCPVENKIKEVI